MAKGNGKRASMGRLLLVLVLVVSTLAVAPAYGDDAIDSTTFEVPDSVVSAITDGKAEAVYIVMLDDDPVIAYEGDVSGYAATAPAPGAKINPNAGPVRRYQAYLNSGQLDVLSSVGRGSTDMVGQYAYSFNGFAAVMTGAEAAALSARGDVLAVWKDELRQPTTDVSSQALGMPGVWEDLGYTGEDVIIGVIDTGIWPENPSFSDQEDLSDPSGNGNQRRNDVYGPAPDGWYGTCQSGELWSQDDCNHKLIGARWFADGFGFQRALFADEYLSARDWDGHGTHTASTAGGNAWLPDVEGAGEISGMAPRARIAAYKACWNSGPGGCATSDLVNAIDYAVADGVDVINYSIGSSAQNFTGPDDIAFLFAADAGVFVATSNGNGGPGANTTGSPSSAPWLTSVGATNHRAWLGEVTLGDGSVHSGASTADPGGTGPLPIVWAGDHGNVLCRPEVTFDPPITGMAVLCDRGEIARVAKSQAVFEQGGTGMVLRNLAGGAASIVGDSHSVPSIHVDATAGAVIHTYVTTDAAPTVDIAGTLGGVGSVASFSSRGLGASEDIIKPDLSAPGVNVLAADAEDTFYGINTTGVGFKSGTSMASPHIAGIGALLVQAHPDWTPAQVKSALMTTASASATLADDGVSPAIPFDTGSGLVQPASAFEPGITYDAGFLDYVAFLCGNSGIVSQGFCDLLASLGYSFDGSDLNQPNVAVGALAGSQTVHRTVTATTGGTYVASVNAPAGIDVVINPASLTLAEGETASFSVTLTRTSAPLDVYSFGSFAWSNGTNTATSQIAARPVQLAAPGSVAGSGTDGSLSFDVDFGYAGAYGASAAGLVPATTEDGFVADDPSNDINAALGTCDFGTFPFVCTGITWTTVAGGDAITRISLFNDYTDGADDLDLYVWDAGFGFAGQSGGGTSEEQVDVVGSSSPFFYVAVHGWQTDGPDANYTLFSWAAGTDEGNLTITAPGAAVLGGSGTVILDWVGLDPDEMYLGAVVHDDGSFDIGITMVEIDT